MTRDRIVSTRLDDETYDKLKRRAWSKGSGLGDFVRGLIEREQKDGTCPECGTIRLVFDPPIEVALVGGCGDMRPGTYTTARPIPVCELAKGHEGAHAYIDEQVITW